MLFLFYELSYPLLLVIHSFRVLPRLLKFRLKSTSPIWSLLQCLLADLILSSFSLTIFVILPFIYGLRLSSPILNTTWRFYSIIWILHLLLHRTMYFTRTIGIHHCSVLPLSLDTSTGLSQMKFIVLTLIITGWWSLIPKPNGKRVQELMVMFSDTHTPSLWLLCIHHELECSRCPCLSSKLSLISKCLVFSPNRWFMILSISLMYIFIFPLLENQVLTASHRSFLAACLGHLN